MPHRAMVDERDGAALKIFRSAMNDPQHWRFATTMYLDKFRLDGRVAIVTGAAQGIGLGCAEALAEAGAQVVIADRDTAAADAGRSVLKAKGYNALVVGLDVTDSKQVAAVAAELIARFGR